VEHAIWSTIVGPPKEKKAMVELLRSLIVFDGLSNNDLILIDRTLHLRTYQAGDIVFEEEMPGAGLYIIKEGEITIKKNIEGGSQINLAVIPSRSFFGELALVDEMPRSASAVASKESTLLAFGKPDLEKVKDRNPVLALKIISNISRLIAQRLVKANENIESLQKKINTLELSAS